MIDGFLRGDDAALRVVDGWIEVVLRTSAESHQGDWEDLKQEIRARIFKNLDRGSFNGHSALRTYVHRIAKNVCIDFVRAAYRRRRHEEESVNAGAEASLEMTRSGSMSAWIDRELLIKILDGFAEQDRRLLELVFIEQCSYAEVARRLSIPEGTVKSRMSRCKDKALAKCRALTGKPE